MPMFKGHDSKVVQIQNLTEMDTLVTNLIDLLGDSPSPIDEVKFNEFLYEVSRKYLASLSQERTDDYRGAYIDILMEQGWTLKNKDIRSHQDARIAFEKALRVERYNPLAHYRLGHIAANYNVNRSEALSHFIEAVEQNGQTKESKYKLSSSQVANANGMAVKLFTEIIDLGSLNIPEPQKRILESSIHTLQNLVKNVSEQIIIHFSKKNGANCEENCISHEKYLELKDQFEYDASHLVIDIADEQSSLGFGMRSTVCELSTIRRLLTILSIDGLSSNDILAENRNSLSQQIRRIRLKLESIGLDKSRFSLLVPDNSDPQYKTSLTVHFFKNIFD